MFQTICVPGHIQARFAGRADATTGPIGGGTLQPFETESPSANPINRAAAIQLPVPP